MTEKYMIFKNKYKKTETQPDWNAFDANSEDFENCGGGWNNHSEKAGDYITIIIDREKAKQYRVETTEGENLGTWETTEGDGGDEIPF